MVYATQIITLLITILWVLGASLQLSTWLYWIQTKEYRLDRFKVLLKSKSGRSELIIYPVIFKILTLIISIYFRNLLPFFLIIFVFDLYLLWKSKILGFRKPVRTERMTKIALVSIIPTLVIVFSVFMYILPVSFLLVAELSLIILPSIGVFVTKYAVNKAKSKLISEASQKLKSIDPTVIAITGSYGKSSTKDFITHLLSSDDKALSSYKNQNTVFGLGRVVINNLETSHKYFVAEMGAYKIGEISEMTSFIKPDISILTGIEPQHLELFGSLENIKKAKYEIIEALDEGIAVVNVSGKDARELFEKAKKRMNIKSLSYALENTMDEIDDLSINMLGKITRSDLDGSDLEILYENNLIKLRTNLVQANLVENLIGAILVARCCNTPWEEIKSLSATIKVPDKTTQIIKRNGNVIIDDSYNSTPKGFTSALQLMSQFNGPKYVITSGIIELGNETARIHDSLAKTMNEINVKKVYVTKKDLIKYFRRYGLECDHINTPKALKLPQNYVLLIEGRIPNSVYDSLI